ncbi:MAG: pyridoxine 5'-phosphate synthase [Gammaproteobacteria bacterium]|nr:pyridoxine 5'-phosphate synthase [Gammaproteobacteria bacterium]
MILLGVNIDHVATVRQARGTKYPDLVEAALAAEEAGADGITAHLREDRRHINDADIDALRDNIGTRLNLEMALTDEMLTIACRVKPEYVCLVPEKRQELTTEGGLDLLGKSIVNRVAAANAALSALGTKVSLFIDADKRQIDAAKNSGCPVIELHTGAYADAANDAEREMRLNELIEGAAYAASLGLQVNAGHGLNYENLQPVLAMPHLYELNIGHSIVARSVMVGMKQAVIDMKQLIAKG